jgi:hypothetical protein
MYAALFSGLMLILLLHVHCLCFAAFALLSTGCGHVVSLTTCSLQAKDNSDPHKD